MVWNNLCVENMFDSCRGKKSKVVRIILVVIAVVLVFLGGFVVIFCCLGIEPPLMSLYEEDSGEDSDTKETSEGVVATDPRYEMDSYETDIGTVAQVDSENGYLYVEIDGKTRKFGESGVFLYLRDYYASNSYREEEIELSDVQLNSRVIVAVDKESDSRCQITVIVGDYSEGLTLEDLMGVGGTDEIDSSLEKLYEDSNFSPDEIDGTQ